MNIVIIGAGTVGSSIAELMCANQHNVCVIDAAGDALDRVEEGLDVQTVRGSGCDTSVLFQAGVQSCDLCLAVTNLDEVNLVGASIAKSMGAGRTVARIFNLAYLDQSTFDYQRHFDVDRLLSLEFLTALELARGIELPGLFAVENFARGGVEVKEVVVGRGAKAIGKPLRSLGLSRDTDVLVGLINTEIPGAEAAVKQGDHVTLIGRREEVEKVQRLFEHKSTARAKVIIAGGGEVGLHLARLLERRHCQIVLMEADSDRCEYLAHRLSRTTVLHADATRRAEMEEARVNRADAFVACMGHDEDNIVCGLEARELGSPRILSIVRRPDYANVLESLGIDVAVSPREVMAQQVLGMVQSGPILGLSEIAGGDAEVWEIEINQDAPITGAPLKDIPLGKTRIATYERAGYVRVASADVQLKAGDTAIVLVQKAVRADTLNLFLPDNSKGRAVGA